MTGGGETAAVSVPDAYDQSSPFLDQSSPSLGQSSPTFSAPGFWTISPVSVPPHQSQSLSVQSQSLTVQSLRIFPGVQSSLSPS